MGVDLVVEVASSLAIIVVVGFLLHIYKTVWLQSEGIRRKLKRQGIKGPSPSLFYGNLHEMQKIQMEAMKVSDHSSSSTLQFVDHDYTCSLFPYFEKWRKQYGLVNTYSTGMRQHLYINQPELVKELNQCINLDLGKPSYVTKKLAPMLGNGILRSNGIVWAQQRKIMAPEFFMEKVKSIVGLMVESAQPLLRKWDNYIEVQGGKTAEIQVDEDLRGFSADVISRAYFGSSYFRGKEIFSKLRSLQETISQHGFLFEVTSFWFMRIKKPNEISCLEREIESLIWETIKESEQENSEQSSYEKNLLHMILQGANNDHGLSKEASQSFVIDNCKNIYFAGHESTAVAISWCLMLLALHPEWQARIRAELAQVCPDGLPDANSLSQLKTVTMVIQEVMRLYPPAAFVSREALEEIQVGNINVPKGVCMWTLIPTLHRDPDIWGPDANEFKPERFRDGVSKACKHPKAYIPFGLGARLCLGRNFAMVEMKVVISLIISKFSFFLSPKYRHTPAFRMIVEPGHGVHIIIQRFGQV